MAGKSTAGVDAVFARRPSTVGGDNELLRAAAGAEAALAGALAAAAKEKDEAEAAELAKVRFKETQPLETNRGGSGEEENAKKCE